MRTVDLEVLRTNLSEYVRSAAGGETILVTAGDRVVAELHPPDRGRGDGVTDPQLENMARSGLLRPALRPPGRVPAALALAKAADVLSELRRDREGR